MMHHSSESDRSDGMDDSEISDDESIWKPALPFPVSPHIQNTALTLNHDDVVDGTKIEHQSPNHRNHLSTSSAVLSHLNTTAISTRDNVPITRKKMESVLHGNSTLSLQIRNTFGAPKRPKVPRKCVVAVKRLQMLKPLHSAITEISISLRIRGQKLKYMLRSEPLKVKQLPEQGFLDMSMDLLFSLGYLHRLKGNASVLQINLFKRKQKSKSFKNQGTIEIPLDTIMQCPHTHSTVTLEHHRLNSRFEVAKLYIDISSELDVANVIIPVGDERQEGLTCTEHHQINPTEEGNDVSYDSTASEASERANSEASNDNLAVEREQRKSSQKKIPTNSLAILQPTLMSKMKMVKQSGTRFFDKLRKMKLRKTSSMTAVGGEAFEHMQRSGVETCGVEHLPNDELEIENVELRNLPWLDIDSQLTIMAKHMPSLPSESSNKLESVNNLHSGDVFYSLILLVDRNTRQSYQLMAWCANAAKSSLLSPHCMLFFGDCNESEIAFNAITTMYKQRWETIAAGANRAPLRVAIAGDDTSVSMILRPFVRLLAREPRGWDWNVLRFYVIPLDSAKNPNDNSIAQLIAKNDPQYRGLFFSSQWQEALDGESLLIEPVAHTIENALSQYVFTSNGCAQLPIAEALLELNDMDDNAVNSIGIESTERIAFPFVRDFMVIDMDDESDTNASCKPQDAAVFSYTGNASPHAAYNAPSFAATSSVIEQASIVDRVGDDYDTQHNISLVTPNALPLWITKSIHQKPIVVEYWSTMQKDVRKLALKTGFLSMCATRLTHRMQLANSTEQTNTEKSVLPHATSSAIANSSSSPPVSKPDGSAARDDFCLPSFLHINEGDTDEKHLKMSLRLLPKDKNKFLSRFGAYSPKKVLGQAPSDTPVQLDSNVTKIVCSARSNYRFAVVVDGLVIPHVKFLSLSPLWPARVRVFPIATFHV